MGSPARKLISLAIVLAGCGPPAAEPLPAGQIAFGVFGDGPYYSWEQGRFRRVLADMNRADLDWVYHVGDILWHPCSDAAFEHRLRQLDSVGHPVVYTPGDNEWADCHEEKPGGYDPLDRLASIRRIFFAEPGLSLGRERLEVEAQARDSTFAEFVENVRWTHGGFVFASVHLVGATNGLRHFPGRTSRHDAEVERRTRAAIAWLDGAFAEAERISAKGIVLATHANLWSEEGFQPREGYGEIVERLETHVGNFSGPVLLIHGDTHTQRVDQPLTDSTGHAHGNFTRLETYGSPEIGWIRVVIDTVEGRIVGHDPRLMRGWW